MPMCPRGGSSPRGGMLVCMQTFQSSVVKRIRVMVASPDRYFRALTGEILNGYGYSQHIFAETARGVLEGVRRDEPNLVLLDEALRVLTATELVHMIRRDCPGSFIPQTILMVAHPTRWVVDEARQVGIDALITKPIIPVRLIRTMEQLQSSRAAA